MDRHNGQPADKQAESLSANLHKLFSKKEMHRVLNEVARGRMACSEFRTFVWHTMAKAAAEKTTARKWEVVDSDLRHKATQLAVIYAMHCIYERTAKGLPTLALDDPQCDLITLVSKAG